MLNVCVAAICSHHKIVVYTATVLIGVIITVLANWYRHPGPFTKAHTFVGAELATGSVVAGFGLVIVTLYSAVCAGQQIVAFLMAHSTPENLAKPALVILNIRLLRYCKNQELRAAVTGVTFTRGMRNTLVGALAFTLSLLAF